MTKDIIEINNLTKRFGSLKAVDNISFAVRRGEIFALASFIFGKAKE